jgi:hypothetical protein
MNTLRSVSLLLLFCFAVRVPAADGNGKYYSGGGAGGIKCPAFVATMEKARRSGIMTGGFVNETSAFIMYLLGFETGYNLSTPETYDIFAGMEAYPMLSWVENYCRANPTANFSDGAIALAQDRRATRQRSASEPVR